tara:strand:+ start:51 stop:749 length:699 start_codon:yes stop_codon:yes gene_type:complete
MTAELIAFKSLFPSPFGYVNFGESNRELNKQLIEDIETHRVKYESKERTFRGNNNSWQSEGELEKMYPAFEKLRKMLDDASKPILKHSGCKDEVVNHLRLCNLWGNVIFDVGGFSFPHIHPTHMAMWTGVYYPQGVEDISDLNKFVEEEVIQLHRQKGDGALVLFDPSRDQKQLIAGDFDDKEYYGGEITIFPRESLLLLFPAWMPHMVMPLTTKTKRYSISFSIVKTYVGS